jgi:hypothetical protein
MTAGNVLGSGPDRDESTTPTVRSDRPQAGSYESTSHHPCKSGPDRDESSTPTVRSGRPQAGSYFG